MKLTYYFLAISITLALFQRNRAVLYCCIAITSLLALYQNIMTFTGAAYMIALAILTFWYFTKTSQDPKLRVPVFILLATFLAYFVLHFIPGFANSSVVEPVILSAARRPVTIFLNFDKIMAGLLIYTLSPLITEQRIIDLAAFKQTMLTLLACIVTILTPAIVSGYVKFDPKIPSILPIWALSNLVFVCFSEEVIFRGFLQTTIKRYLPSGTKYTYLAIFIASVIFGLAHYKHGVTYMCLAAICGLFYGYAYDRTRIILCAMLVHFFLNFAHFLVFSYPS